MIILNECCCTRSRGDNSMSEFKTSRYIYLFTWNGVKNMYKNTPSEYLILVHKLHIYTNRKIIQQRYLLG